MNRPQRSTRLSLVAASLLMLASCSSTSVRTFATPEEATEAIVLAAEAGDMQEATRIFETFASSSVQRDRVYASLFGAAEERYASGRGQDAASILGFVTDQYPSATAAREALVYALFIDRADRGVADDDSTRAMEAAIEGVRSASENPSAWVDLAAAQTAIDRGAVDDARREFRNFKTVWDGGPPALIPYVEDIERYLASH